MSDAATTVELFLSSFAAGDIPTLLSLLDPECVVVEADGVPYSGTYVGPDGFVKLLGLMSAGLDATIHDVEVLDAGSVAIARNAVTFVGKITGHELSTTSVEIYRVRHGKILHGDVYYKDPAAIAALFLS